jgi:hypothetical protein
MSLSNLDRCKAWIANKPKVDVVRGKLAAVEEKLLLLDANHPKRKDFEETMKELLLHLQQVETTSRSISINKIDIATTTSGLAFDADPSVSIITDPQARKSAFELLKSQLGSGADLLGKAC